MKYISRDALKLLQEERKHKYSIQYPFPYIVIDNFLNENVVNDIADIIERLDKTEATTKFIQKTKYEYNKYAFTNLSDKLEEVFAELNSPEFLEILEKLTGIVGLVSDKTMLGSGIHKTYDGGYLGIHTDFNMYTHPNPNFGKLDRRINLLIYMNPKWEEEYNGYLELRDKKDLSIAEFIRPILNRCVIFNTTNSSLHGHPIPLHLKDEVKSRNSIANYYYTKNNRPFENVDFEGDKQHSTNFYEC